MKSRAFKLIVEIPVQPLEEEGDGTTTASSEENTKVSIVYFRVSSFHYYDILNFHIRVIATSPLNSYQ